MLKLYFYEDKKPRRDFNEHFDTTKTKNALHFIRRNYIIFLKSPPPSTFLFSFNAYMYIKSNDLKDTVFEIKFNYSNFTILKLKLVSNYWKECIRGPSHVTNLCILTFNEIFTILLMFNYFSKNICSIRFI